MSARGIVVAIDGPAGAGKSTVAKAVARQLGYRFVDTGAIYRAVALTASRRGVDFGDEEGLARLTGELRLDFVMDGERNRTIADGADVSAEIRAPEISKGASKVSALPRVRAGLLGLQRTLAGEGGAVLEGRDIGTVVFPAAELKVFLDASLAARAKRRHRELVLAGTVSSLAEVEASIAERDARDMGRSAAPLAAAKDAVVLDTTELLVTEVIDRIVSLARARGSL